MKQRNPLPICEPLPLLAVMAMAINDHWLKGAGLLPGAVTGKLSDIFGLFFFPILLISLLPARRRDSRQLIALAVLATGVVFTLSNLSVTINNMLRAIWLNKVMDPSDLWALAVLPLSWAWLMHRRTSAPSALTAIHVAALCASLLASAATSPARVSYPRRYPVWVVTGHVGKARPAAPINNDGVLFRAQVGQSGKSGLGLFVCVENTHKQTDKQVGITAADTRVGQRVVSAAADAHHLTLKPGEKRAVYIPFPFDSNATWNAGQREGSVNIATNVDGQKRLLRWKLFHAHPGPHRTVYRYSPKVKAAPDARHCGFPGVYQIEGAR